MKLATALVFLGFFIHAPLAQAHRTAEEHAKAIEAARLSELIERALEEKGSKSLRATCRYASHIAVSPPAMKVALTFDDGPSPSNTPFVLETLAHYGIRATFFLVGEEAVSHPDLVDAITRAGHLIVANHSWTHANFHTLSVEEQRNEISKNDQLLGNLQDPRYFRYPYGNSTCESNQFLRSENYKIVGWHVDSCDWGFNATGTVSSGNATICGVASANRSDFTSHVVSSLKARRGGILLMHDVQPNTIRKLPEIIDGLLASGYEFGSLDDPEFQASLF